MYLDDQRDSKGKISFISFEEGFPKVHDVSLGRNVLNQQPKFPAKVVLSNEIWNILDKILVLIHVQSYALSEIQQLQQYAIVFRNVRASDRSSPGLYDLRSKVRQ